LASGQMIDYLSPEEFLLQDVVEPTEVESIMHNLEEAETVLGEAAEEDVESIAISQKSDPLQQLENIIERDPEAVAQLLRNWLDDEPK